MVKYKALSLFSKRWLVWLSAAAILCVCPCGTIAETNREKEVTGEASFYNQRLVGQRTTSGEPYDDKAFTAAHSYHPFGTYLLVTLVKNQQSVVVRVNDRFRPRKGHLVDVSMAAAKQIDLVRFGRAPVTLRVLAEEEALSLMTALGQSESLVLPDSVAVRPDSVAARLLVPDLMPLPSAIMPRLPNSIDVTIHDVNR